MTFKNLCGALALTALTALAPITAAAAVPQQSTIINGLDLDSMKLRLQETDIQPLEGIWYYPNEQITLGIERFQSTQNIAYRIILLDSDDINTLPGTIIGYIAPTALNNKFQLWLYSERDHITLINPLQCVATLNNNATSLTFEPPHWRLKIRVNIARFLPTLFNGISITPSIEREQLPIGFRKIYPQNPNQYPYNTIRYL